MNEEENEIKFINKSFIKLMRSEELLELLKHQKEFALLTLIAYRANYKKTNHYGLKIGECFVDYLTIGLTRQQYRTALKNLEKWGYVTTRLTSKSTTASKAVCIANSEVYDVVELKLTSQLTTNQPVPNQSLTSPQPVPNQSLTTNIDLKDLENIRSKENAYAFEGKKIKLIDEHFQACVERYKNLDVVEELKQLDLELSGENKWFMAMHAKLNYRNNLAREKQKPKLKAVDDSWMDELMIK